MTKEGARVNVGGLIDVLKVMRCQAMGAPELAEHLRTKEERARALLRELVALGVAVETVPVQKPKGRGREPALYRLAAGWGGRG